MDKVIPVKVAVRIRPLNKKENNKGSQAALEQVALHDVIPRSVRDIFKHLESKSSEMSFKVGHSFMEQAEEELKEEVDKLKAELRKTLSEQERDDVQVKKDELQA